MRGTLSKRIRRAAVKVAPPTQYGFLKTTMRKIKVLVPDPNGGTQEKEYPYGTIVTTGFRRLYQSAKRMYNHWPHKRPELWRLLNDTQIAGTGIETVGKDQSKEA